MIEKLENELKRAKEKRRLEEELAVVKKVKEMSENEKDVRNGEWSARDIEYLNKHLFLTSKPVIYLVNIGMEEYVKKQNKWLPKIQAWVKENGGGAMIPYSADFESQVVATCADPDDAAEKAKVAEELGAPSMIDRVIKAGYKNLQLVHYFTAGEDEVKCWTIRQGTKAPGAAGVIHTDFEKGFICADCMKFDDLDRLGSTQGVKDEGLYRQQGKDYLVLDGDILHFKFNVSNPAKNKDKK